MNDNDTKVLEQVESRPKWNEDKGEMLTQLSKAVGKIVNDWCEDETTLEECIECAEEILKWHLNDDGYSLAKEFEDKGFGADSQLVDELNHVSYLKHQIENDVIKKWVLKNNLKLDLLENQKVIAKIPYQTEKEYEITKLYPETMQYGLWNESVGGIKGKRNIVVNAEYVVKIT